MWSSARHIARLVNGKLLNGTEDDRQITGFSIDSRTIHQNECFVAIPGSTVDGHKFVSDAFDNGAVVAVIEHDLSLDMATMGPLIKVPNTLTALQQLAHQLRKQFDIPILGITGSTGKTTTKELLFHILTSWRKTFRSPGNYNSEVGLPLAVLQMPESTELGIFELALQHPGDIKVLCEILEPTHGLITSIGEAHAGNFADINAIADEKWELARHLPNEGTLIINGDSLHLTKRSQSLGAINLVQFGIESEDLDYVAEDIVDQSLSGIAFTLRTSTEKVDIASKLLGRSSAYAILGAAAMAISLGVSTSQIQERVASFEPVSGRMALIQNSNVGKIIDDSYNANPASMREAIRTLDHLDCDDTKVLVIGDMLELGQRSHASHIEIAHQIAATEIEHVYTIGIETEIIKSELENSRSWHGQVVHTRDHEDLLDQLDSDLGGSSYLILIKGSRGMALDRVIEALS